MSYSIANDAITVTTQNIGVSDLKVYVQNTALFPVSGKFDIKLHAEIMLVTNVNPDSSFTVVRGTQGTVATTHGTNSTVKNVLTAAFFNSLVSTIGTTGNVDNFIFPGSSGASTVNTVNYGTSITETYSTEGVTITSSFPTPSQAVQVFTVNSIPGVAYTSTTVGAPYGSTTTITTGPYVGSMPISALNLVYPGFTGFVGGTATVTSSFSGNIITEVYSNEGATVTTVYNASTITQTISLGTGSVFTCSTVFPSPTSAIQTYTQIS